MDKAVTKDRSDACKIIEKMLERPDALGICPTTNALDEFEQLLSKVRIEALGWTWAEACVQLDKGGDPRRHEQGQLIERIEEELNPPNWMSFGRALEKLKQGKKVRLPHWSEDVYLAVQFPGANSKMTHPYIYATSRYGVVPWVATQVEMLSDKWMLA